MCLFCYLLSAASHADTRCTLTTDEALDLLAQQPWEGFWHSHDTTNMPRHSSESGEHFHATHRDVIDKDGCLHATILDTSRLHETADPEDEEPEGRPKLISLTDDDDPETYTPKQAPTEKLTPDEYNWNLQPEIPTNEGSSPDDPSTSEKREAIFYAVEGVGSSEEFT